MIVLMVITSTTKHEWEWQDDGGHTIYDDYKNDGICKDDYDDNSNCNDNIDSKVIMMIMIVMMMLTMNMIMVMIVIILKNKR